MPSKMVIVDKNGGFLLDTLLFQPLFNLSEETFSDSKPNEIKELKLLLGSSALKRLESGSLDWSGRPSDYNEELTMILHEANILKDIEYYDFSNEDHFNLFIDLVKESHGDVPTIPITKFNFINIYDKWFKLFAPANSSRRNWADKFVLDLRTDYQLNEKEGKLISNVDEFRVPVSVYKNFYRKY
jgi:hypothetical protein